MNCLLMCMLCNSEIFDYCEYFFCLIAHVIESLIITCNHISQSEQMWGIWTVQATYDTNKIILQTELTLTKAQTFAGGSKAGLFRMFEHYTTGTKLVLLLACNMLSVKQIFLAIAAA